MTETPPHGYPPPGPHRIHDAPTQHLPAAVRPPEGPPPGPPQQPAQQPPQQPAQPQAQQPARQPPHQPHQPPQPPVDHPVDHGGFAPGQPATHYGAPRARPNTALVVLGLVGVAATVLGLSLKENGHTAWHAVHAWGAVAILGALLTLAPAARNALKLTAHRAWQVAACGAGALALFWVLFVLPDAGSNTSLVTTLGVAAGVVAAWLAAGQESGNGGPGR
jgi:hypothetical protein